MIARYSFTDNGIFDWETGEVLNKQEILNTLNSLNKSHNACRKQQFRQANTIGKLLDEKEKWKSNCSHMINENSILWNEISIMREQGAKPSKAFEQYLNSLQTDYDKFWEQKKAKGREDGVIK